MSLNDKIFKIGMRIPEGIVNFFTLPDKELKFWLTFIGAVFLIVVYLYWWLGWQ